MKRLLILALTLLFACSSTEPRTIYSIGLGECEVGGESAGGMSGAAGEAAAGEGGEGGASEAGAGGSGPLPPTCGIDDPIAIAESLGLIVEMYYHPDDPELSGVTSVSNWNDRKNNRDLLAKDGSGVLVPAYNPSRLEADPTLGNRASVTGDGVDDRLIENSWSGPGKPSQATPWGFVQLAVKYGTWKRARQGWGSQQLPTRGVHSGEWRGWRMDNGGSPLIILAHANDGEWTRTIHQFTGTWGHDWACVGATCSAPVGKNTGSATSSSRAMFGCNNVNWDPVPAGGNLPPPEIQHEQGMCFNDQSHGPLLHYSGYLDPSNYDAWDNWIDCYFGSEIVALD